MDAYYESARKHYLVRDLNGTWMPVTETSMKMRLAKEGIRAFKKDGELISPLNSELIQIQDQSNIAYSGPLAGYQEGIYHQEGNLILVTNSPKWIPPVQMPWPVTEATLKGLLGYEQDPIQWDIYRGWLKVGCRMYETGSRQPGQMMTLAGPTGCGKSFSQEIITQLFGGRSAKPYRYMTGGTVFNRELFGAEHLMVEDEAPLTDMKSRMLFGCFIKNVVANKVHSCHGKAKEACSLKPNWRVSCSVNEEQEQMLVLPPMIQSIAEKIILLRAYAFEMPMPSVTQEEKDAYWDVILSELPGFLYHLRYEYEIPEELKDKRYGITSYHNPELLNAIEQQAPENRLMTLIDNALFDYTTTGAEQLELTAEELSGRLLNSDMRHEARPLLLGWQGACGTYLGRLATKMPDRVQRKRKKASRIWIISKDMDLVEV